MATTSEARSEPLTEPFDTLVRRLTSPHSPTGTEVDLQTVETFRVGGAVGGFLTGGITVAGSPTYNAGELLGDAVPLAEFDPFIGDGTRVLDIHSLVITDPSYTLDVVDGVANFAVLVGNPAGTGGDAFVPSYTVDTALTMVPDLRWSKVDAGDPGVPTGVRYLTTADAFQIVGTLDHVALVATDAISSAFLAADPDLGQAVVVARVSLL